MDMRLVNYKYINQVHEILSQHSLNLSNRRLKRLAYIYQFGLYNRYKKIVHSDASNNQMIVLGIVLLLVAATIIFLSKVNLS